MPSCSWLCTPSTADFKQRPSGGMIQGIWKLWRAWNSWTIPTKPLPHIELGDRFLKSPFQVGIWNQPTPGPSPTLPLQNLARKSSSETTWMNRKKSMHSLFFIDSVMWINCLSHLFAEDMGHNTCGCHLCSQTCALVIRPYRLLSSSSNEEVDSVFLD